MDTELTDQRRQQTAALWAVAAGAVWTFTLVLCETVSSAPMFHAGDAEAPLIALFGAIAGRRPKEGPMNANTELREMEPVEFVRDDRVFRVEYEPSTLATGWQLRERHHDGWPVLAGPYETRDEAIEAIEEFLEAGPLCCYEDEYGIQSCFV